MILRIASVLCVWFAFAPSADGQQTASLSASSGTSSSASPSQSARRLTPEDFETKYKNDECGRQVAYFTKLKVRLIEADPSLSFEAKTQKVLDLYEAQRGGMFMCFYDFEGNPIADAIKEATAQLELLGK